MYSCVTVFYHSLSLFLCSLRLPVIIKVLSYLILAFRAIFSHIFTAHAQERPLMNFRLNFWHHHSIPWSRFPYRARYFGDTRTISDDFCIGYVECPQCPPYFYFRSSWPTDLESVSHDDHLAVTVSTKFEVDTTIRCLVIALLLLIRYVTLWPWPMTFWLWSVVIHGGSRGQPLHQVWRSYVYPFLSYEFWHLPYDTIDRRGQVTCRQDFRGNGSSPYQCIDTTRKAIECSTTVTLTVFI